MSATAGLEQGFRRLLAWYPRPYWREHEEEMLAVLLASAREGQRRPGLAESAGLIRHALVLRLRPRRTGSADTGWHDALAVFSVAAPLLLVLANLIAVATDVRYPHLTGHQQDLRSLLLIRRDVHIWAGLRVAAAGQLAVAAAAALRLRRVTLAVIAVSVLSWIFGKGAGYYPSSSWEMFYLSLYALEAAALAASPGPRRGLQLLMTWRRGIVLAVAAVATGILWKLTYGIYLSSAPASQRVAVLVVLASIAIGMTMSSGLGRHLVVLFAIMFYPFALGLARQVAYVPPSVAAAKGWLILMYLPLLLLAGLAATAWRHSRQSAIPPTSPDALA
jgi:hypothetical protein